MENTDTLLDFGDDSGSALSPTPQGGATVSATAGDPFDPFGGSAFDQANDLMSSDTLLPTAYDDSSDLFDPFAGPKMSAATTNGDLPPEQQQHYENQFADLLGDLGSSGTVQNGDIGGETITTVTKTTTEVLKDGETVTNTTITTETDSLLNDTNQTQESEGDAKDDKKAIDYMKARYEGKEELQKVKLIREPKKLDHQWGKQTEEDENAESKEAAANKGLPREQDLVQYTSLGTDYSRKQYENKVEKETAAKEGRVLVPVNRQQVEKVAPPEITKSVRAMFETGQLPDIHEVKKTKIDEPPPESGVYENQPVEIEGVIRSTDFNMEGEELKKGMTKDLLNEWSNKGQENGPKEWKEINVAEDEGKILENEPIVRSDVTRETDADVTEQIVLQKGHAKHLKDKLLNRDDGPKERKPIKLVENEEETTVFENQPQQLEGVVRSDDMTDEVKFERGKAKNLAGFWATRTDEVDVKKEAIKIDKTSGPVVLESQPQVLEGVVRADDIPESEKNIALDSGRTKNIATMWGRRSAEDGPKAPRQPIKMDLANSGPSVLENEPVELEGVVRCDTMVEDVIPGNRGRTKDIAGKFLKSEEVDTRPRKQIQMERSSEPVVLENEPAPPPEGVVRGESYSEDVNLETGRTKNLVSQWVDKESENLSPKTSQSASAGDKPRWIKEIEAARDSGVYENEPTQNEDVVRESDIQDSEKQQLIPDEYTKTMRNVWKQKEAEEANPKIKNSSELVRFTPPREITPPPVHQQEYQSTQKLTLTPKLQQNGHMNGHQAQQPASLQQQQQYTQASVHQAPSPTVESTPPLKTVKSSTMLVLK